MSALVQREKYLLEIESFHEDIWTHDLVAPKLGLYL